MHKMCKMRKASSTTASGLPCVFVCEDAEDGKNAEIPSPEPN